MSYVRYYVMEAKPGGAGELRSALSGLKKAVERLPGILGVELLQDLDRPESFHFVERWDSRARHGESSKLLPQEILTTMKAAVGAPPAGFSLGPVADG